MAGRVAKRSTSPRPASSGSSARPTPAPSAGYRFGTTRTVQPGLSRSPPEGRRANSSGGVLSSCPSRNGSRSGSSGGRGSARSSPPGRPARSPATTVRSPVSGSSRSSGTRVPGDVAAERRLVSVLTHVHVLELSTPRVEDRLRERPDALEHLRDLAVAVLVARVGDRVALQEGGGVAVVVHRVDPDERHALSERERQPLEVRELRPAGPAPRRPLVHDHRVSAEGRATRLKRRRPAAEQLAALAVERRERRRRARQRRRQLAARPAGALPLATTAAARLREAHDECRHEGNGACSNGDSL